GALLARWRRPGRRGGGPPRRVPHRPRRSRHRVAAGHGAAPAGLRRPRHAARAADHQCGRGPGGGTGAGLPAAGLAGGQPERRGRRPVMVRAVEVVRRFRRLRALVIGDAMLDSYLEGTAARLCTEGPVPVVRKTAEERVPGGAANTAANLRALGAEVVFLGLVGEDVPGDLLRAALAARGVDDRWLVADPAVSTLHKLRILADGQYVVRFDEGDSRAASPAAHARLLEHLEHAVPTCDVVVVSDYAYGAVADDLIAQLRTLRAARHCPLVVDSKALHRFHAAGAPVVTPNYLEARLAVAPGAEEPGPLDLAEVKRIGRGLLEQG